MFGAGLPRACEQPGCHKPHESLLLLQSEGRAWTPGQRVNPHPQGSGPLALRGLLAICALAAGLPLCIRTDPFCECSGMK